MRIKMTCSAFLTMMTLGLALVSSSSRALPDTARAAGKPNVVLIVIDAFRADRIFASNHGKPVMPVLAAFAKDSWQFTDAMTAEAWTKPAMASIYTSLHADAHGVQFGTQYSSDDKNAPEHADALPASIPNIATILQGAGYDTIGVQTNPHLQARFGFANGFNRYTVMKASPGILVTPAVLGEIKKARAPFFLYVHYFDPHTPYLALPPYNSAFGDMPVLPPAEKVLLEQHQEEYYLDFSRFCLGLTATSKFPPLSDQGRDYLRHCYDVECRLVDDQLRQMFAALAPLAENTLIVLTADHGEELWDHGELGHEKTAYEELLHVPLLFHHPSRLPKKADATPVETVDILPTIAGFLGLPPDPGWQGVNRMQAPSGSALRPQFSQCKGAFPGFPRDFDVVKSGSDKLIVDRKKNTDLLFDLGQDPRETRNLATAKPEKTAELHKLLETHSAQMKSRLQSLPHESGALDEETKQSVKALGYLAK